MPARSEVLEMTKQLRRWVMTWPHGKRSVSKMSDFDFALDPGCQQQVLAPVDWLAVREHARAAVTCLKTNEDHLTKQSIRSPERSHGLPTGLRCRDELEQTLAVVRTLGEIDARYSSWRNDCYLGWLSLFLLELICTLHEALMGEQASLESWPPKWMKGQLELEGLFFYVDVPWHVMVSQPWPVAALMARLAGAMRLLDKGNNLCDNAEGAMDGVLRRAGEDWWQRRAPADADTPLQPLHLAEEFLVLEAPKPLLDPQHCTFGVVAAYLSVTIWALKANLLEGFPDGPLAGIAAQELVSGRAQQMTKLWEERTPQFFYDFLTSHWRLPELLEQIAALWPQEEFGHKRTAGRPMPPMPGRRILFIGGGDTTYQWGSFTVRGRQVARGFRNRGIDARAWNSPCTSWCQYEQTWHPTSIVHVKYVCQCAILGWPRAAHVFDPVDNFDILSNATRVDAILVQTSLSKLDLEAHPTLRHLIASGQLALHWLPLHHLNAHRLRINPASSVTRVGVHTVHTDTDLREVVEQALDNFLLEGTSAAPEFVHLDPATLFEHNEGKITTPQHTDAVYQQLSTLQIGFAKQSGCRTDWFHCSRWKTGQRLVNMMSVGIPSIVWADAQGHLDVVHGLWAPEEAQADVYPKPLVVSSGRDVSVALHALLSNVSLRLEASDNGSKLATRFELDKMVARLDAILLEIEARQSIR